MEIGEGERLALSDGMPDALGLVLKYGPIQETIAPCCCRLRSGRADLCGAPFPGLALRHRMMTTLHVAGKTEEEARIVWESFPSWAQFSWLYLLSAFSVLRGALFFRFGLGGWEMWVLGAGVLLTCAAVLRHWVRYQLTREQITVRNYYTGREIQSIRLNEVKSIEVRQGVVADFFGIGTVLVHARTGDRSLSLRGVRDPEEVKSRIEGQAWKHHQAATNSQPPSA